jgi:hypothetical protein
LDDQGIILLNPPFFFGLANEINPVISALQMRLSYFTLLLKFIVENLEIENEHTDEQEHKFTNLFSFGSLDQKS